MQYADVAVNIKTANRQTIFSYLIPPKLLVNMVVGQRIFVPFYNRQLIGTVVALRSKPPKIKGNLKTILGLVDPIPLFNQLTLTLLSAVATDYGTSIGQMLAIASPKPAIRIANKIIESNSVENQIAYSEKSTKNPAKLYGIYVNQASRYQAYLQLIKNALLSNKKCLIIFPTQNLAIEFADYLIKEKLPNIVIAPTAEFTNHYVTWVKACMGKENIVIGSRKSIFVSLNNLGLIIVDSPSQYGFKDEQSPYYNAVTVAKLRAKIEQANLVIGDVFPRIEEWNEAGLDQLTYIKKPSLKTKITVIDTVSQRGLISESLVRQIEPVFSKKGKIAVIYNRKSYGRAYQCIDCKTSIYCPICDLPLITAEITKPKLIVCYAGHYEIVPPNKCLMCSSENFTSVEQGIEKIAKLFSKQFPHNSVKALTKELDLSSLSPDILVATAQLLFLPKQTAYDQIITFQLDQLLHGSSWNKNEIAFLFYAQLASRTRNLIIHTAESEHPVIQSLAKGQVDNFYQDELKQRNDHHYPPNFPLIMLTFSGHDDEKLLLQAQQIYHKIIEENFIKASDIFPPIKVFNRNVRQKIKYQIFVKSKLSPRLLALLPSNCQIDTEPYEQ